jgi:vacuolar protein sorting-associated protein 33A
MTTPLTYEGLLDELIAIDCGFIKVDINTINPEDEDVAEKKQKDNTESANKVVALGVNGSDSLFAEVRDQHVEKFGIFLQKQAKAFHESHQNFTSKGKNRDLTKIHQFVKQIPVFMQNLQSLTNHIHLAELVKAFSEEATFPE